MLELYRQVRAGQRVKADDTNQLVGILRLAGIVRLVHGWLEVRNRIYERVFDRACEVLGLEVDLLFFDTPPRTS